MPQKFDEKELYANAIDDGLVLTGYATVAEDKPVEELIGIVTDCLKLNVRKEPKKDSDVVAVAACQDELLIDTESSTDDWYAVYTASGIEGFCMKNFVAIKQ